MTFIATLFLFLFGAPLLGTQPAPSVFSPARLLDGSLPSPRSPTVVGWIEETVEVQADESGRVVHATLLRAVSKGPSVVVPVVADWRFRPATDRGRAVPSRVLVAAMIRPPALYDLPGSSVPTIDFAMPSGEIPFPTQTMRPQYPPRAVGDAVVLVEVLIERDGRVSDASVTKSASAFDEAAMTAARGWTFRPAFRGGEPVTAFAYLIFGFRQPVAADD